MTPPTWTVIGAGSALPRVGYGPAGYALRPAAGEPVTLFDCGPGTIRSLAACGIHVREVERVVISHFHADHFLDVFALAFARHNPALGSVAPIELVGPRGLARRLEGVAQVLGRSVGFPDARIIEVEVTAEPTLAGSVRAPGVARSTLANGPITLSSVRTRHTDSAVAWRADVEPRGELPGLAGSSQRPAKRVSVAYTGDTCEVPEVAALAQGVDLFVAECSFPDGAGTPNHLTPSSAARLARDAGAGALLLSHFYPGTDPTEAAEAARRVFPGRVEVAVDGLSLELP